jgi:hypothetical protein
MRRRAGHVAQKIEPRKTNRSILRFVLPECAAGPDLARGPILLDARAAVPYYFGIEDGIGIIIAFLRSSTQAGWVVGHC